MSELAISFRLDFEAQVEAFDLDAPAEVRVALASDSSTDSVAALGTSLMHCLGAAQFGMGGSDRVPPRSLGLATVSPSLSTRGGQVIAAAVLPTIDVRYATVLLHVLHVARCDGAPVVRAELRFRVPPAQVGTWSPQFSSTSALPLLAQQVPFELEIDLERSAHSRALVVELNPGSPAQSAAALDSVYRAWSSVCIAGGFVSRSFPPERFTFMPGPARLRGRWWEATVELPMIDARAFDAWINMLVATAGHDCPIVRVEIA